MSVLTPLSPSANPVWMFIDPQGVQPLRTEAFGEEHLEQFPRDLAQACRVERKPRVRQPLLRRFRDNSRFLEKAHHELSEAVRRKEPLSADAEWLLDNYYIIANVVREVKRDLPASYYAELPVLAVGPAHGFPRVFALAFGLIAHTDSSLDENEISRFVRVYQNVQPLSIGELWAVPAMLRLGLLENLRRLADQLLRTRTNREQTCEWARKLLAELPATSGAIVAPPWLCDSSVVHLVQTLRDQGTAGPILEWLEDYLHQQGVTVGDVLRREHQRQAANQVSIGNAITSLRLLDALDWSHFFEQASHVEALLHEDPAGAYPKQDFATRDRYRRAVEQLAKGARIDEEEVARRVVEVADTESDRRRRHVGFWLIDEGRRRLEKHLGYRARWNDWLLAKALRHPSEVYFGSLAIVLALLVGVPAALLGGGHFGLTLLLIAILLLPVSELAVHLVHFLVTRWMPPTVLPKLDFRRGIPSDCATFVVIPGMLTRAGSAAHLLERLEVHYLANVDPNLSFALLTDFADAAYQETPEEQGLVRLALNGIRRLNKRYGADGKERFFLFHRRRQWNPSESCWMGWERKRGKLQEFNRLLRGDGDTSFTVCSAPLERLPAVRYVLTLDADTTLPREVAQRLVGTLAHPLELRASSIPEAGSSFAAMDCCSRASAFSSTAGSVRASPGFSRGRPASIRTPPPFRMSTRTSSARGAIPARGSMTSTPSKPRRAPRFLRTTSSVTISSNRTSPAAAWRRTSKCSTIFPPSTMPSPGANIAGFAATGNCCRGWDGRCHPGAVRRAAADQESADRPGAVEDH